MKNKFVYVSPKSTEAKVDFTDKFMSLHSCRVLEEDSDSYYVENIKKSRSFIIRKSNDQHWYLIK